jgi:hypothetical protein
MSPARREVFREMFGLIYQCFGNREAVRILSDRILARLAMDPEA